MKKEDSFVKSFYLDNCEYSMVNFIPQQLWDIFCFCLQYNGIICINTTFEICYGLYLADTTYPNLSLYDINGKHPEFLGASFRHFKKNSRDNLHFAGELLIYKPLLTNLHKIGYDLKGLAEAINFWLIQFYLGWGAKLRHHVHWGKKSQQKNWK